MIHDKNKELKESEELAAQQVKVADTSSRQQNETDSQISVNADKSNDDEEEGWVPMESGLGINE